MPRYIYADSLYALVDKAQDFAIQRLLSEPKTLPDGSLNPEYIADLVRLAERTQIKDEIANAITADVVEVVRCKDCLYWKTETEPIGIECEPGEDAHYCDMGGITRSADFCSYGKREKPAEPEKSKGEKRI